MLQLVYSPKWFYGKDLIIDAISILVLCLIAFFSIKYYKINKKNKNYLFLAISFILLALSFLFKIVTNFTIYYNVLETRKIGLITLTYHVIKSSDALYTIGFFLNRVLMLLGLFMLYCIYTKPKKSTILLISYLIVVLLYFSRSVYHIFHLTALILAIAITYQYWKNYKEEKHITNKLLFYSFSIITLSHVIFMFIGVNAWFYVAAEIIQLVGYISLLLTLVMVIKYGKKKGKK